MQAFVGDFAEALIFSVEHLCHVSVAKLDFPFLNDCRNFRSRNVDFYSFVRSLKYSPQKELKILCKGMKS